jgi:hypothetical protein
VTMSVALPVEKYNGIQINLTLRKNYWNITTKIS